MSSLFGVRLKKLRESKNLKQSDLAKALKSTVPTISAWELARQEPSMEKLKNIAIFFNVDINYLFGADEKTKYAFAEWEYEIRKGIDEQGLFAKHLDETEVFLIIHEAVQKEIQQDKDRLTKIYDIEPVFIRQN